MFVVMVILLHVFSQHAVCVEVYEGEESVLLPCSITSNLTDNVTVVWGQKDRKHVIVHAVEQSGVVLDHQDRRYVNRTTMRADALQTGNLSLTLRNPTLSDNNNYTCTVRRFGEDVSEAETVPLTVKARPVVSSPAPTPVTESSRLSPGQIAAAVVVPVVVVGVVVLAVWLWRRQRARSGRRSPELSSVQHVNGPEEQIPLVPGVRVQEVESGVESVLLPSSATAPLSGDVTVEWKHRDNRKVHVYCDGSEQPDRQEPAYKDRTQMEDDFLTSGDLTLTLKYPRDEDKGTFTCIVYNREGTVQQETQVKLQVKVQQEKVPSGAESVVLPFSTTPDLPADSQVWWERDEPAPVRTLYVYCHGSEQPERQDVSYSGRTGMRDDFLTSGDLSLTLTTPTHSDEGTYTCRVFSAVGFYLREKRVSLSVTGSVQVNNETVRMRRRTCSTD